MSRPLLRPVPRAVLFDFDFTLADSSGPSIECVNYGLRALGLPEASTVDVMRWMGSTLTEILVALAGQEQRPRAQEFTRAFERRADEVMVRDTVLFSDVPDCIDGLKLLGCRLGIISTKYRYRIEATLERERMLSHFDVIIGGEDVDHYKPAPDGLLRALDGLGVRPDDAVYLGDSVPDAEAAEAASVPFVAVLSGAASREEFAGYPRLAILPRVTRSAVLGVLERRPDGNSRRA